MEKEGFNKFNHITNRIFMKNIMNTLIIFCLLSVIAVKAQNRIETNLSGKGWKLWYDKNANWKDEELYLTNTDITKIKTYLPTGGWSALNAPEAKEVSVPGTLEEYFQENIDLNKTFNKFKTNVSCIVLL